MTARFRAHCRKNEKIAGSALGIVAIRAIPYFERASRWFQN
jgi:hypothetical protein